MAKNSNGRLRSRPKAQKNLGSDITGLRQMGLDTERDGFLYVPRSFDPKASTPLFIVLHGAGGTAQQAIDSIKELADQTGTILVAPQSQGSTWDRIGGGFGPDIELLDEALSDVFALYPIDPEKVAIGGGSDGGAYALLVGLANAELFSHTVAVSPGAVAVESADPAPKIFLTGGRDGDLVSKLKAAEVDVTFEESTTVDLTPELGRHAFAWFLGDDALTQKGARVLKMESSRGVN